MFTEVAMGKWHGYQDAGWNFQITAIERACLFLSLEYCLYEIPTHEFHLHFHLMKGNYPCPVQSGNRNHLVTQYLSRKIRLFRTVSSLSFNFQQSSRVTFDQKIDCGRNIKAPSDCVQQLS